MLLITSAFSEEFAVIVNASNDEATARSHFLLIEEAWSNGAKTLPFEVDPGGSGKKIKVQKAFLKLVLKMNIQTYRQHWVDRKASGRTVKPTLVRSYQAVKKFVQKKKGGIGYLPKSLAGGNVKIIKTFSVK